MICNDCKLQLIDSYKFMMKALMAFGDLNHNTRSKILKNVHKFLNSSAQLGELSVVESCDYSCLAILTPAEKEKMTYQGWQDFGREHIKPPCDEVVLEIVESDDDEEEEVPAQYCEVDIKAEEFQQNNSSELLLEESVHSQEESIHSQEESIHSQDSDNNLCVHNTDNIDEMSTPNFTEDRPAKPFNPRKPPRWLKDIMKKCETLTGTVRGWTCAVCKEASFSYYKGMKLHLLNTHFKQHMKTFKIKPTAAAPQNDDGRHEYDNDWIKSILRQSRNEEADNWNCILCNNFTGRSLPGTRSHIVKIHCKRRETEDDTKAAEDSSKPSTSAKASTNGDTTTQATVTGPEIWRNRRHKRDGAWIREMMEKSQTGSSNDIWNCCICHNFITISDNGIRWHIYKAHCEETSDLYKETDESEGGEDDYMNELDSDDDDFTTKKKVRQFNREKVKKFIEKTIDSCETQSGDSKSWECVYCKNKFTSSKGIRCHLVKMHRKEMKMSGGTTPTPLPTQQNLDKYKKKILTDDGLSKEVWTCPSCPTVFDGEAEIRAHINAKHRSNGKLKSRLLKKSMLRGRKLSLNGFSPLRAKIHRRTTIGGKPSTVETEPKLQIKMEEDETEEVKTDVPKLEPSSPAPTKFSQLSSVEKIWAQECMIRSKIDNGVEDYYKCWLCKSLYLNRGSAMYHMIVTHFPFWRRGPAEFAEHYKQFLSPEEIEEFRHIDEEEEGEGSGDDFSEDETVSEMTESGASGKFIKASEMSAGERSWLRITIKQSKKTRDGGEIYWDCKMCQHDVDKPTSGRDFDKPGTFRYHMIIKHLASLRDNPDYEQIIAEAIAASGTDKTRDKRVAVSGKQRKPTPTGKFLKASEMTMGERNWLATHARKSRKLRDGSEYYWQCCFCDREASRSNLIR